MREICMYARLLRLCAYFTARLCMHSACTSGSAFPCFQVACGDGACSRAVAACAAAVECHAIVVQAPATRAASSQTFADAAASVAASVAVLKVYHIGVNFSGFTYYLGRVQSSRGPLNPEETAGATSDLLPLHFLSFLECFFFCGQTNSSRLRDHSLEQLQASPWCDAIRALTAHLTSPPLKACGVFWTHANAFLVLGLTPPRVFDCSGFAALPAVPPRTSIGAPPPRWGSPQMRRAPLSGSSPEPLVSRTYVVCSYGGSGSKMLSAWLSALPHAAQVQRAPNAGGYSTQRP
jgi:hypothetical protein